MTVKIEVDEGYEGFQLPHQPDTMPPIIKPGKGLGKSPLGLGFAAGWALGDLLDRTFNITGLYAPMYVGGDFRMPGWTKTCSFPPCGPPWTTKWLSHTFVCTSSCSIPTSTTGKSAFHDDPFDSGNLSMASRRGATATTDYFRVKAKFSRPAGWPSGLAPQWTQAIPWEGDWPGHGTTLAEPMADPSANPNFLRDVQNGQPRPSQAAAEPAPEPVKSPEVPPHWRIWLTPDFAPKPPAKPKKGGGPPPPAPGPGTPPSPAPGPTPTPTPTPDYGTLPPGGLGPTAPPGPGVHEKKFRNYGTSVFRILGHISEASEVVDCLYKQLPVSVRRKAKQASRGLTDSAGQYGIKGADWKSVAIYDHLDKIGSAEMADFLICVSANQIEDQIIGRLSAARDRIRPRKLAKTLGRKDGWPTLRRR